ARPPCGCCERTTAPEYCSSCSTPFVGADFESLASPQAAKLALSVAPPLPTEPASLGFGGAAQEGSGACSCSANTRAYWSSCSTPWGTWLAWASMAWADWIRMLFLV
ncbi:hypothetical protein GAE13_30235, partial [Bacteroides thetaiotaomicron]